MVHHTFILPLLAAVIISSHVVVGQQQPTYYPTWWPTYAPTAADTDDAEYAPYGQEKSIQDETSGFDWAKWTEDLKAMISGSSSAAGDDEEGNDDDDTGDKSIGGGWPTYHPTYHPTYYPTYEPNPTYYPTYEPTQYQGTENDEPYRSRSLQDSSSNSGNNNNQGDNGQDNNSSNNNNGPSPTYNPTYVPTTYEPTTEERTLQVNAYGRQPPEANTGVYNAGGMTVTLVTAAIASVTFLFV